VKLVIAEKCPALANGKGASFHQDSACPRVLVTAQEEFRELKWEILSQLLYSPDLALLDYHLFRSFQNSLDGRRFEMFEGLRNHIKIFFDFKPS
jgi:hypothetical protein